MKTFAAMAAGGVLLAFTSVAQANTLDFLGSFSNPGGTPTYDASTVRGTLTCSLGCAGLDSNYPDGSTTTNPILVPDATNAQGFTLSTASDLFSLANDSVSTETAFVNAVTGQSFPATGTQVTGQTTFTTNAQYVFFKIGASPDVTVVMNNSGAAQTYSYSTLDAQGSGLSHYMTFGSVVPLPPAALLFGSALGGIAFISRRKKCVTA